MPPSVLPRPRHRLVDVRIEDRRIDDEGAKHRDGNVFASQVVAQKFGQTDDGELAGAIDGLTGVGVHAGDGGGIDDVTALAVGEHPGQEHLDASDSAP